MISTNIGAEHHRPALGIGADELLEQDDDVAPTNAAEQRADAADDGHQQAL